MIPFLVLFYRHESSLYTALKLCLVAKQFCQLNWMTTLTRIKPMFQFCVKENIGKLTSDKRKKLTNIKMAQLKQKQNYNRKHSTPMSFKVRHAYNSKFYCYCQSQIGSSDCMGSDSCQKYILYMYVQFYRPLIINTFFLCHNNSFLQ